MKVSLSVEAAGAERGMVHAGFARGIAGSADQVSSFSGSDGSSGADGVAFALVHVESISTIVTDEVLGALEAS